MAGVLTPPAAIASSTAPANVCSESPGRNSATAAAIPASATRSAVVIAATSSGVLIRRAVRITTSPSTSWAFGNAIGSNVAKVGEIASVPTRLAVGAPSIFFNTSMSVIGFQARP